MSCKLEEAITDLQKLAISLKPGKSKNILNMLISNTKVQLTALKEPTSIKLETGTSTEFKDMQVTHAPRETGPHQVTEKESIAKYQNEVIEWTKKITGVTTIKDEDLPIIGDLMAAELSVIAARYHSKTNTIRVMPDDVSKKVEQRLRDKIYTKYMEDNGIEFEDFDFDIIEAANAATTMDIKSITRNISEFILAQDSMHQITHESIHAGALLFMTNPKNLESPQMKRIQELFELAKANQSIIDAGMEKDGRVDQYWTTDIHEFVAEGLSNPQLINVLSQIRYDKKDKLSSIFKEFVSALLDMLGLTDVAKNNMHEYLLDAYASMLETQIGNEYDNAIGNELLKSTEGYKDIAQELDKSEVDKMTARELLEEAENMREECN